MRTRLPLRLLPWLCVLLPSFAFGQENQARRLEGLWVEGAVLRALDAGERRELGCFLRIEAAPLRVIGTCGREVLEWPLPALLPSGQATIQVRSGYRGLVLRTGTPNELEVQGADGMHRLYRVPRAQIPLLLRWAWAEQRLVGSWRAEDGASLELRADGTFAFEQEDGRYDFRDDVFSDGGAWGLLTLQGERERRYLLHGEKERLGLAALPPNLEFDLVAEVQERGVDDAAVPEPTEARRPRRKADSDLPGDVLREPDEHSERVKEALARGGWGVGEDIVVAAPSVEGDKGRPVAGEALPSWLREKGGAREQEAASAADEEAALRSRFVFAAGEREPEVTLWFERRHAVEDSAATEDGEASEEVEAAAPPPSEPILPPSRICGCEAGQGRWAWLALAPLFFLQLRRRWKGAE